MALLLKRSSGSRATIAVVYGVLILSWGTFSRPSAEKSRALAKEEWGWQQRDD